MLQKVRLHARERMMILVLIREEKLAAECQKNAEQQGIDIDQNDRHRSIIEQFDGEKDRCTNVDGHPQVPIVIIQIDEGREQKE